MVPRDQNEHIRSMFLVCTAWCQGIRTNIPKQGRVKVTFLVCTTRCLLLHRRGAQVARICFPTCFSSLLRQHPNPQETARTNPQPKQCTSLRITHAFPSFPVAVVTAENAAGAAAWSVHASLPAGCKVGCKVARWRVRGCKLRGCKVA